MISRLRPEEGSAMHVLKTRVALVGLLTLLVIGGAAASTASAAGPYWRVNGARLGQGVAKQIKFQLKGPIFLKAIPTTTEILIECKSGISEGATIEGQGNFQGQDKGRFTFRQCRVIKPLGCAGLVEPITTNQLKSYLAYNNTAGAQQKFVDVFEPQQGNVIVVFKQAAGGKEECLVAPEATLSGSFAAEIVPTESENQENLLSLPETAITSVVHEQQTKTIRLTFVEGSTATLKGAFGARLETGERWGVFGT
jgi:hypothetical protein